MKNPHAQNIASQPQRHFRLVCVFEPALRQQFCQLKPWKFFFLGEYEENMMYFIVIMEKGVMSVCKLTCIQIVQMMCSVLI